MTILIINLIACCSECKRQGQQLVDEVRYFGLQYCHEMILEIFLMVNRYSANDEKGVLNPLLYLQKLTAYVCINDGKDAAQVSVVLFVSNIIELFMVPLTLYIDILNTLTDLFHCQRNWLMCVLQTLQSFFAFISQYSGE